MTQYRDNHSKLYIFYCSNCIDADALDLISEGGEGDEQVIISLPCSGKVDLLYLLKAFETGAEGLVLITCPENECHYLEGNLRAPRRVEEANAILEEAGMGRDRILVLPMNGHGADEVAAKVAAFRDRIRQNTECPADREGWNTPANIPSQLNV